MISILILTDDEPNSTISQQNLHDVVIEIDDNGDGHITKNRHGRTDQILDSKKPGEWRDFIQAMAIS